MMSQRLPTAARRDQGLFAPMIAGLVYLLGTFLLFLVVGQVELVPDLAGLIVFVLLTILSFAIGYVAKIRTYSRGEVEAPVSVVPTGWIKGSAAYYAIYGAALLLEYGAKNPLAVFDTILHPANAYFAKFAVYDLQNGTGRTNGVIQVMTILAGLYTPLIPFVTLFWDKLSKSLRVTSIVSASIYAVFFLFIGTLKGLGDLLVFLLAAYLIRTVWRGKAHVRVSWRRLFALGAVALTLFVAYMAVNQSQRLQQVGIESRFQANPVIASLTGEDFARGLAVVAFYPTHGYLGLSYNLGTPFVWSQGLGASRALNSYWIQYVGGEGATETAYPVRTEARTGWPADQYWSTIYPWLASDLTFPGTVLFMGFLGWFLAKFWFEGAYRRSLLAVLLFCQLILLIAYVPANNQIGTSRTSLLAFICLGLAYVTNRRTADRVRP